MRYILRVLNRPARSQEAGPCVAVLRRVAPTALAIVPVSMLFGVLAARADWTVLEVLAISLLGFSGSGQFALLPLAEADAGFLTMLLVTASINSRYLPIAYASARRLPTAITHRAVTAHMLGDEAYATEQESDSWRTILFIRAVIFATWAGSGAVGAMLGQFIPYDWIGEGVNLGFPASVVLMYLSVSQLRSRLWLSRNDSRDRSSLLFVAGLCAGAAFFLINLVGPLYFWIPSILFASVLLGRARI
ncbi:AzlC family ABC transporter permease [Stutzerimonas decontaminans]|uniref:AzlC family ABC transporter permease n=1 Tax=Stutzerimonas decontaminans TaxID=3022791 RepID=UPI0009B8CC8B|nr:AzlC family ABC transporter permease [Stutzerimonas decontaminans]